MTNHINELSSADLDCVSGGWRNIPTGTAVTPTPSSAPKTPVIPVGPIPVAHGPVIPQGIGISGL